MRFDLIGEQMQYLFIHVSGILADMQKVMRIRLKAGHIRAILKHPKLAFIILVMRIFADLEMVYFFLQVYSDGVIFHRSITYSLDYCLLVSQ